MTKKKTVSVVLTVPAHGSSRGDVVEADEKTAANLVRSGVARYVDSKAAESSDAS